MEEYSKNLIARFYIVNDCQVELLWYRTGNTTRIDISQLQCILDHLKTYHKHNRRALWNSIQLKNARHEIKQDTIPGYVWCGRVL
jgi:hypothetical protein